MFAAYLHETPLHDELATRDPAAESWASMSLADLAATLGTAIAPDPFLDDVRFPVRRLKRGETLYRAGDPFDAIYVVRSGFFKTTCVDETGTELVLEFPMGGDVIGLHGFAPGQHTADVVALDTSYVAVASFARLTTFAREHPCIEQLLYGAFSRELTRERSRTWLLGTLNAEARVATFLLELAERLGRLGYSRSSFALRMTREEIGSYLGIKLETVSRTLSAFAAAGLIAVDRKMVTLRDPAGLLRIVQPTRDSGPGGEVRQRVLPAGRLPAIPPCTRGFFPVTA